MYIPLVIRTLVLAYGHLMQSDHLKGKIPFCPLCKIVYKALEN